MNVGHDVLQDAKKKKMHLFDTEFFKLVLYENHGNYYLTWIILTILSIFYRAAWVMFTEIRKVVSVGNTCGWFCYN